MQSMGVVRFILPREFAAMGYPATIVPEMVALHARNQTLATDVDEKGVDAYLALARASVAASAFGDLPLVVVWASESYANYDPDAMREVSAFSANSVTRVIEDANHGSILGSESLAQQVSNAILDVINAAKSGEPLD
jgi:hypothetical protein